MLQQRKRRMEVPEVDLVQTRLLLLSVHQSVTECVLNVE